MPTTKPGQKRYQVVFDEQSEVHTTLMEWAEKRGLSVGRALRCIAVDWSDAINGRTNPFAAAIAAGQNVVGAYGQEAWIQATADPAPMSEQEKARQAALLEAAEQFL